MPQSGAAAGAAGPRVPLPVAAWWLTACFVLAYAFDIGRGFIKDDYSWITFGHLTGVDSVRRMFVDTPMGFYRPLVSLSFGLNELLSPAPFAYAFTNLALAFAIAVGIFQLGRRLHLTAAAALFAAAVWAFNFHGINVSLLWISGRTSLLGTVFAVWAAVAFVSSRVWLSAALVLAAVLSKEEPLLLPTVFAVWAWLDRAALRDIARRTAPSFLAIAAYLALRSQTNAFTPATAPDFYRSTAAAITGNIVQYADRATTLSVVVLLLGATTMHRARWRLTSDERAVVFKGLIWLAAGFALTLPLPVRSSLYALLPSVGSALAASAIGSAIWRATRWPRAAAILLLVLPLALWPVYRSRNARVKDEAKLASSVLDQLRQTTAPGIVIVSPPGARPSMEDAFANTLPQAIALFAPEAAGKAVVVGESSAGAQPGTAVFVVRGAALEPQR